MSDRPPVKRRSKNGCNHCRSVSRKCDEVHPRCGRCRRLQFNCIYRTPGWIWKDQTPKYSPEEAQNQLARAAAQSGPVVAGDPCSSREVRSAASSLPIPDESCLISHFITHGHRALHWSPELSEQFLHLIRRLSQTCPALKEAILAFELLAVDAPEVMALSRVGTTLDLFRDMLQRSDEWESQTLFTTGFFVCHIAMQTGHRWTLHLESLLAVLTKPLVDADGPASLVVDDDFERLAGLDMEVWYVGRTTPSLRIWSTFCTGRDGIEPTANLPRSLMDLLARVPLDPSVMGQLQMWEPPVEHRDAPDQQISIWHAFRLAAMLRLYEGHRDATHDPSVIAMQKEIMSLLKSYWSVVTQNGSFASSRMIIFPLFIAGTFTVDADEQEFLTTVFNRLCPLRRSFPRTNFCSILQEFWRRRDEELPSSTITLTPNLIALEWGVEVGVW